MKFSAALSLCVAPLAIAKHVNNRRDISHLNMRTDEKADMTKDSSNMKTGSNSSKDGKGNNGGNKGGNKLDAGKGSSSNIDDIAAALLLGEQLGIQQASSQNIIIIWVSQGGNDDTKTVTVTATATAGAQATAPPAGGKGVTHQVTVGGPAGLVYSPDSIQAAVGDMVVFTFLSQNHTVTQSGFTTPCKKMAGGMDTGFMPNVNNSITPPPQVAMQVMTTQPLWFYCRQTAHCGKGMTFSINPTANKTQAMFQSMAIAQNGTGAGGAITGNAPAGSGARGNASTPAKPSKSTPTKPSKSTPTKLSGSTATKLSGSTPTKPAAAGGSAADGGSGSGRNPGVTTGTGTLAADGSCVCAVICAAGSFPAAAQGAGAFGGSGGGLPAKLAMVV